MRAITISWELLDEMSVWLLKNLIYVELYFQLEKAEEIYRKLRRPTESSACYERLGFFDKAIDTLYDHEMYDMAFDTLKRFKIQKKVTNFKIALKSVYL